MTAVQKTRVRLAAFIVAGVGLLIPVTLSPGSTVEANDACADGYCCPEMSSICERGGELHMHYYDSSQPCKQLQG